MHVFVNIMETYKIRMKPRQVIKQTYTKDLWQPVEKKRPINNDYTNTHPVQFTINHQISDGFLMFDWEGRTTKTKEHTIESNQELHGLNFYFEFCLRWLRLMFRWGGSPAPPGFRRLILFLQGSWTNIGIATPARPAHAVLFIICCFVCVIVCVRECACAWGLRLSYDFLGS